jgi:deazaflavin-dependent oxidoreductase (nitroreductase family)
MGWADAQSARHPGLVIGDKHKRRRVRVLQRYLLNPPVMVAVWAGLVRGYVLIETQGRRTRKRRRTVVGMDIEGSTGWVIAEQGRHAGYVRNIEVYPNVRVRIGRRWRPARACLVLDDDPQARLLAFNRPTHAATIRRFGTDLVSVRVDFTSA